MQNQTTSYKDLEVWKKSLTLSVQVYDVVKTFPKEEMYGLTSQLKRSSVSIPSNIAEGRHRGGRKEYVQFLRIARGSCAELETQVEIAKRLSFLEAENYEEIQGLVSEVGKMLHVMIKKLNS